MIPPSDEISRYLHASTFDYLKPTDAQMEVMRQLREAAKVYADKLETLLPMCADKVCCLRKLREVAMWANVAVTRYADGSPREK